MTLTLDTIISINHQILTSNLEDELLMMDMDQGYYYGLQGVGKRIWEQLEEPIKIRDLCTNLQQRYAADADTIEREVLAFLADLQGQSLIEIHAE